MMWKEHTDNALSKLLAIFFIRTYSIFNFSIKIFFSCQQPRHKWKSTGASVSDTQWERNTRRFYTNTFKPHHVVTASFLWPSFSRICGFQILHRFKSCLGNFPLEIMGHFVVKIILGEGPKYPFSDSLEASIIVRYISFK